MAVGSPHESRTQRQIELARRLAEEARNISRAARAGSAPDRRRFAALPPIWPWGDPHGPETE